MSAIHLPKQWLHWAQCAGLKPECQRGRFRGFYLRGKGRNWRVNDLGNFETSCPREFFDRWANSRGASCDHVPQSKAEFVTTVRLLHAASKDAR